MGKTSIEWTDRTWNPVRGCSRVSRGCVHCYAEKQAARFAGLGMGPAEFTARKEGGDLPPFFDFVQIANGHPQWTGKVELVEKHLTDPLHWREPQRVFVNSMSDLFHENLPDEAIDLVVAVMALAPQHTFQVLTKRPERMRAYLTGEAAQRIAELEMLYRFTRDFDSDYEFDARDADLEVWPLPNVWLGVSVEDQKTADERIPLLLQTPAAVRFVSYEPALGPVDFACRNPMHASDPSTCQRDYCPCGLDWVIVVGESGSGVRPFDIDRARSVIAQCRAAVVACFVKQLGSHVISRNDTGFEGDTPISWPMDTHYAPIDPRGWQGDAVRVALRHPKGGDWNEWPEDLRVRDWPGEREVRP